MTFDFLDARMLNVAEATLLHFRQKYGNQGLRIEQDIDSSIGWRPTISLRPNPALIIAIEVADNLYPEILKIAAYDIERYSMPIAVYQSCSLTTYQNDAKQSRVNQLQRNGLGIITVDDDGLCTVQRTAVPLAQHIAHATVEHAIAALTPSLKVQFRSAYETYLTNISQGLQSAGQIVEGIIGSLAHQAMKAGEITSIKGNAAGVVDDLYESRAFRDYRASLGAARTFLNEYRNSASHPSKSGKQALLKMQKCRKGFVDAVDTSTKLVATAQKLKYSVKVHTT